MNKKDIKKVIEKLNHVLEIEKNTLSQKSLDYLKDIKVQLVTENDNDRVLEIIKELVKWFSIFIASNST